MAVIVQTSTSTLKGILISCHASYEHGKTSVIGIVQVGNQEMVVDMMNVSF